MLLQGQVSILAHSLGSVLCYEILCNQIHLFDQLERNLHDPIPKSDTSQADAASVKRQLKPIHPQASAEIPFAPMSSRDLEGDYAAPHSVPTAAARSDSNLSRSLDSRTIQKSKVRQWQLLQLVAGVPCVISCFLQVLTPLSTCLSYLFTDLCMPGGSNTWTLYVCLFTPVYVQLAPRMSIDTFYICLPAAT